MSAAPARSGASGDLASVLDGILRRHGMGVLENPRRVFALLRDHASGSSRDVRVLVTALESGAPHRFRAGPASEAALVGETDRMIDLFGCDPALARAALDTWNRSLAAYRASSVQPLPSAAAASVRPLPLPVPLGVPGAGPPIQPLPAGAPQPIRPLPLSTSPAPGSASGWFGRRTPTIGAALLPVAAAALPIAAAARLLGQI